MKKILIAIFTLLVTAASTYGQDVTTFLGIPIDGLIILLFIRCV